MENHIPPFTISNTMLNYISSIMEKLGKLDNYNNLNKMPYLRRNSKIKSIHSSLAIEDNSLSLEQVRAVISGKEVIGPRKEVQEVLNAYKAYDMIKKLNPYSLDDLKKVHGVITYNVVELSGEFRRGGEGVFDGDKCIFVCPPAQNVPFLMTNLFSWMNENKNKIHPLILSSIFHYEFVFIHPFMDGNGRTVRLWQNVLLYNWKDVFEYLPIESRIMKYQDEYYNSIAICHKNGNSDLFIEFMLKMIDDVLDDVLDSSTVYINEKWININKLLDVMEYNNPMTSYEIMNKLGIKSKETLRKTYLDPSIEEGVIALTIPDKPTSKNQMYYKV